MTTLNTKELSELEKGGMNWKKIKDIAWFVFIWVFAINLIEYQADSWMVETAGDLFGALALMFVALMWEDKY